MKLTLKDVLNFDKMITPTIIIVLYWIGVALSVIAGIVLIITGLTARFGGGLQVLSGLIAIFVGPIMSRVSAESLLVVFKINENLAEVRDHFRKS